MCNLNQIVFEYRSKYKRWITELYKYCVEFEIQYKIILIDWHDILKRDCITSLDRRTKKEANPSWPYALTKQ